MNWVPSWTDIPARNKRLAASVFVIFPLAFAIVGYAKDRLLEHGTFYLESKEQGCLPWLFYYGRYRTDHIVRGDLIAFRARSISLFKDNSTIVKLVAGVNGDVVDIKRGVVRVNGRVLGDVRRGAEKLGFPMDHWDTHYVIGKDEFFMLGTEYRSFDSRYWGVIKREQIIAKLSLVA